MVWSSQEEEEQVALFLVRGGCGDWFVGASDSDGRFQYVDTAAAMPIPMRTPSEMVAAMPAPLIILSGF
jgi:hypothetical protein